MKRNVAVILIVIMVAAIGMTGCGAKEGTEYTASAEGASQDKQENGNNNEIVNLVWQWPSFGTIGSGFQDVEDALNEMLERDIGVHVTLEPVGLYEAQNEAVLMVSAGEQLDICLTAFTGVGPLVDKGLVYSLDELIEVYGADAIEHCGIFMDLCYYDGKLYGVPTAPDTVTKSYGYTLKKSFAEKYGIVPEDGKIYTMDEIEDMFEQIKSGEETETYMVEPWDTTEDPLNNAYMAYDKLGGSLAAGVLMLERDFEDLTIVNLFETPEYKAFCERMYSWAQKGYIAPDAAVSTEIAGSKMDYDNYTGNFEFGHDPRLAESETQREVYSLLTVDYYAAGNGGGGSTMWNIPITSVNPEKAMETINYLFKNKEAAWLLQHGLEGENYQILEDNGQDQVIRYLYEDDYMLHPYLQPYGLYGDRLEMLISYPGLIESNAIRKSVDESVPQSRYSKAWGYSFVQDLVATEVAAVSAVISQYTNSLNCGALNPDQALPEFIEALRAAGIDKIIAENQRQFDEWIAAY